MMKTARNVRLMTQPRLVVKKIGFRAYWAYYYAHEVWFRDRWIEMGMFVDRAPSRRKAFRLAEAAYMAEVWLMLSDDEGQPGQRQAEGDEVESSDADAERGQQPQNDGGDPQH